LGPFKELTISMPVVPSKLPDVVLFEVQELRRVRDHDQVLRSCVAQQVPGEKRKNTALMVEMI